MLEILKYIFSSFWIWLGFVIILAVLAETLARIFGIIFQVIYSIIEGDKNGK